MLDDTQLALLLSPDVDLMLISFSGSINSFPEQSKLLHSRIAESGTC